MGRLFESDKSLGVRSRLIQLVYNSFKPGFELLQIVAANEDNWKRISASIYHAPGENFKKITTELLQ